MRSKRRRRRRRRPSSDFENCAVNPRRCNSSPARFPHSNSSRKTRQGRQHIAICGLKRGKSGRKERRGEAAAECSLFPRERRDASKKRDLASFLSLIRTRLECSPPFAPRPRIFEVILTFATDVTQKKERGLSSLPSARGGQKIERKKRVRKENRACFCFSLSLPLKRFSHCDYHKLSLSWLAGPSDSLLEKRRGDSHALLHFLSTSAPSFFVS